MAIGTLSIYSKGYVRRAVHESSNTLTVSVLLLSCTALLTYRSEEHTSELQSRLHLVCRLLLEKKKTDTPQLMLEEITRSAVGAACAHRGNQAGQDRPTTPAIGPIREQQHPDHPLPGVLQPPHP